MTSLSEKLSDVRRRIEQAAQKSGRSASDITLAAVTKNAKLPAILEARSLGVIVFAENRIQDAQEKIPQVAGVEWHMIGHLQTNKIGSCLDLFQCVQSVDSIRLAEKLNEELVLRGRTLPVLLEVNVSGEAQKHGFSPEEIYAVADAVRSLPNLEVRGVMGIAVNSPDPEARRASFKKLKGVFTVLKGMKTDRFQMKVLSMGMSDDFEIAIEEGSNLVRIGSAIFGAKA